MWGPGLSKEQIRTLQASQNRLLRWICGLNDRMKTTAELHEECGQLTVNQMIVLWALSRGMKVLKTQIPYNLHQTLVNQKVEHEWKLRSSTKELQLPRKGRYHSKTWRNLFLNTYERVPEEIRLLNLKTKGGKNKLKVWFRENIASQVTWGVIPV